MYSEVRWPHARLFVSDQLVEWFRGWLEFAGPDYIKGVAHCPSWPKEFRVQELGMVYDAPGLPRDPAMWGFDVFSPEFDKDYDGWCPTFHKHDEIGPTLEGGTWACGQRHDD